MTSAEDYIQQARRGSAFRTKNADGAEFEHYPADMLAQLAIAQALVELTVMVAKIGDAIRGEPN